MTSSALIYFLAKNVAGEPYTTNVYPRTLIRFLCKKRTIPVMSPFKVIYDFRSVFYYIINSVRFDIR